MAHNSHIEWTDATWNPITGCSVVSPGCTNCYAMKLAGTRLRYHWSRQGLTIASKAGPVWNGEVRLNAEWLTQPLSWQRPRRIFVCAHGDLFHESVPDEWIDQVFAVMALAPQHTFQVLTKRSARMRAYMAGDGLTGGRAMQVAVELMGPIIEGPEADRLFARQEAILAHLPALSDRWPLPNVWLGVSAEDQARADERIPDLLATPAAVRFLSAEPLLGPLNLTRLRGLPEYDEDVRLGALEGRYYVSKYDDEGSPMERLDWIIAGGESGPGARPMHPDWARKIRDDCAAAGVPFFFKQWGDWRFAPDRAHFKDAMREPWQRLESGIPGIRPAFMVREGKKTAGRLLDGVEHNGMPEPRA